MSGVFEKLRLFWDTTVPKPALLRNMPGDSSLEKSALTNGNPARMSSIGWGTGFISGNILRKEHVDGQAPTGWLSER